MFILSLYLLFAMVMVMAVDLTRYTIPNWLVGSVLVAYPVMAYLSPVPVDWQGALMAIGICFAVGYILFLKKWMGGGDIKLIIVISLWMGMEHLLDFLFLMTIIGGVFSVILLVGRKLLAGVLTTQKVAELPRVLKPGAPVPYGVAIASSFIYMMWKGQVPGIGI